MLNGTFSCYTRRTRRYEMAHSAVTLVALGVTKWHIQLLHSSHSALRNVLIHDSLINASLKARFVEMFRNVPNTILLNMFTHALKPMIQPVRFLKCVAKYNMRFICTCTLLFGVMLRERERDFFFVGSTFELPPKPIISDS